MRRTEWLQETRIVNVHSFVDRMTGSPILSPGGEAMRINTYDKTRYRNDVRKWKFLIHEYELVKRKRHPKFRFV